MKCRPEPFVAKVTHSRFSHLRVSGADTGLLDYLVLETSGAADPRRIVGALEVRFGPLARVRLDRVVTVVDAT